MVGELGPASIRLTSLNIDRLTPVINLSDSLDQRHQSDNRWSRPRHVLCFTDATTVKY